MLRLLRMLAYSPKDPRCPAYDPEWLDVYPDDGPGHGERLAALQAQMLGLPDELVIEHWQACGQELQQLLDQGDAFGTTARLVGDCRKQISLAHLLSLEAAQRGLELYPAAA